MSLNATKKISSYAVTFFQQVEAKVKKKYWGPVSFFLTVKDLVNGKIQNKNC